jgi:hypothetical protein
MDRYENTKIASLFRPLSECSDFVVSHSDFAKVVWSVLFGGTGHWKMRMLKTCSLSDANATDHCGNGDLVLAEIGVKVVLHCLHFVPGSPFLTHMLECLLEFLVVRSSQQQLTQAEALEEIQRYSFQNVREQPLDGLVLHALVAMDVFRYIPILEKTQECFENFCAKTDENLFAERNASCGDDVTKQPEFPCWWNQSYDYELLSWFYRRHYGAVSWPDEGLISPIRCARFFGWEKVDRRFSEFCVTLPGGSILHRLEAQSARLFFLSHCFLEKTAARWDVSEESWANITCSPVQAVLNKRRDINNENKVLLWN